MRVFEIGGEFVPAKAIRTKPRRVLEIFGTVGDMADPLEEPSASSFARDAKQSVGLGSGGAGCGASDDVDAAGSDSDLYRPELDGNAELYGDMPVDVIHEFVEDPTEPVALESVDGEGQRPEDDDGNADEEEEPS